jgi:hypothetical protein
LNFTEYYLIIKRYRRRHIRCIGAEKIDAIIASLLALLFRDGLGGLCRRWWLYVYMILIWRL